MTRYYHHWKMEMAMATLFATPLPSPVSNNKIYSPMAEWTFSWCRSGRACDTLIWGKFTSTRCISYYRWTGEHDVVVVVGSMIIFCFRVFTFTFTGCIEVCNEGIKCFIAALLLAIHDRLSKRIGLEYYGTFFDGIVCLNIMEFDHHSSRMQTYTTTKAVSDSVVFFVLELGKPASLEGMILALEREMTYAEWVVFSFYSHGTYAVSLCTWSFNCSYLLWDRTGLNLGNIYIRSHW